MLRNWNLGNIEQLGDVMLAVVAVSVPILTLALFIA